MRRWLACRGALGTARPTHHGLAEISNIRSMGNRARSISSGLNSTRGSRFAMQSWSFSSVFIFMNLHSVQRQMSLGAGMKILSGHSRSQAVQHSGFRHDDDLFRGCALAVGHHLLRRANFIRQHSHGLRAFGMRDHRRVRKFAADARDARVRELDVDVTVAPPQRHRPPRLLHHP